MEQVFKRIEGGLPPSFAEIGEYRKQMLKLSPNPADESQIGGSNGQSTSIGVGNKLKLQSGNK